MITIFKDKNDIPQDKEYVELNDIFFNQNTAARLDEKAAKIIEQIDDSRMLSKYKICSRFNGNSLDIDKLSAGCKTVLNVLYYPEKIFCLKECGDNALEILYHLDQGQVYSDYAMISFEMDAVCVIEKGEKRVITDYEELKEWWEYES